MDLQPHLHITKLSKDGLGIAVHLKKAKPLFVPYSLPGEEVEVSLQKRSHKHIGSIISVSKESPFRVKPVCIHFGSCGGCQLQHMHYEAQCQHKQEAIFSLFEPFFGPKTTFLPLIPSSKLWGYRNKMEFSFSENLKKDKFLGLILARSRGKVFTCQECHLCPDWMVDALKSIYSWWEKSGLSSFYPPKNIGSLKTCTFRQGNPDRAIILTVSGNPEYALKRSALDAFLHTALEFAPPTPGKLSVILRIQQQISGHPTQEYEMRLTGPESFRQSYNVVVNGQESHFEYLVSPSAFLQPNLYQANSLYSTALSLASLTKEDVLYDLYAGIGIFGMSAASFVKEVIAIECNPDAVYDGKTNSERLNLSNVQMIQGDVFKLLSENRFPSPDIVLLDPPRAGLGEKAISQIVKLAPSRILYVSCNPVTQAQDVASFCKNGYELSVIQPIDQFPHTYHVENIVKLERN